MIYAVLGQSVSALRYLEKLRASDSQAGMICVAFDAHPAAFPERFIDWMTRKISHRDVIDRDDKFYQDLNIQIIRDKKLSRINAGRKTLFFDDKSRVQADVILIAESEKRRFPDIKGTLRQGVFSLQTYAEVEQLLAMINRIDTIVLESRTLTGVLMAQTLAAQDKEVILCLPSDRIRPDRLTEEASNTILTLLEHSGVRVIRRTQIQEILGEQDVKAVRLNVGKVIAAEVVIFPEALPDLRIYSGSGLEIGTRIDTDVLCRTSVDGVFALDAMGDHFEQDLWMMRADGCRALQEECLDAVLAGHQADTGFPGSWPDTISLHLAGREISVCGTLTEDDVQLYIKTSEEGLLEKCLALKDGFFCGAFLMNRTEVVWDLTQWIQGKKVLDPQTHPLFADCRRFIQPPINEQSIADTGDIPVMDCEDPTICNADGHDPHEDFQGQ